MKLLNGAPATALPLTDRAIQFGDGLFRTIKLHAGGLIFWERHYRKLCADCSAMGMIVPDESVLLEDCDRLITESGLSDGVIKIMVTRGESARGYAIPEHLDANRIVQITSLPAYPDTYYHDGVVVRVCKIRASWQPVLAGIKHLNRLDSVLARREWSDPAIFEGLLLDRDGYVQEGVMSNIFIFSHHELITPDLTYGGVAGVLRGVLLGLASELGITVALRPIVLKELLAAQRVWLTNSLIGLLPVAQLGDKVWRHSLGLDHTLAACLASKMKKETIYPFKASPDLSW